MRPPHFSRSVFQCGFALGLSLLLHGGIGLACWLRPEHSAGLSASGRLVVETCRLAAAGETEAAVQAPAVPPPPPARVLVPEASEPPPLSPAEVSDSRNRDPVTVDSIQPAVAWIPATQNTTAPAPLAGGSAGVRAGQGMGNGVTSFCQIATRSQAIVYVIDRSASMGRQGALDAAKQELLASLELLPASARFQVIVYNRLAEPLRLGGRSDLVPASDENKGQAALLLHSVRAEGSTEHVRAMQRALVLGPDTIFFLTDAHDLQAEAIRTLTAQNHGRCAIHVIELAFGPRSSSDSPLATLANKNRGVYRVMERAPENAHGQ